MMTEMTDLGVGRGVVGGGRSAGAPSASHARPPAQDAQHSQPSNSRGSSSDAPLVASCRHLLRPNGSILGADVARTILPLFPSVVSAIPADISAGGGSGSGPHQNGLASIAETPPSSSPAAAAASASSSSSTHHHALASIDGRRPIGHARIRNFVHSEFGPALHSMGFGRGHRVAVVLPNGPELAMAILGISNWASCVPLNAAGSVSELEKDLRGCDADLVIGPHSGPPATLSNDSFVNDVQPSLTKSRSTNGNNGTGSSGNGGAKDYTPHHVKRYAVMPSKSSNNNGIGSEDKVNSDYAAFDHVRDAAVRLGIPFVGLQPSRSEAGIFSLVGTEYARPRRRSRAVANGGRRRREGQERSGSSQARPATPQDQLSSALSDSSRAGDEADKSGGTPQRSPRNHAAGVEGVGGGGAAGGIGSMGNGIGNGFANPQNGHGQHDDDNGDNNETVPFQGANTHSDEVLVLFTSGTTGTKKLVPHLLGEILVATATISLSWNLTPSDTNCNLMPLFHVGGIVRQVFSPVLSGGCVICCPNFDPSIFWALLNNRAFNWYYAAPTMHQIILQTGKELTGGKKSAQVGTPKLRMIANAAGGLLPSLATELRKTFRANVLPSYGMTECMPISSPPSDYRLERPGTSGVAVGPEIAILDTNANPLVAFPPMREGPICVRGAPCFRGYGRNHSSLGGCDNNGDRCQPEASFLPGGWFNTGDLGYLDPDGYLYITGRSKEVINRGGEIISPLEVEEAVLSHPDVKACAAFSTPHDILQEAVGIAVVPEPGRPRTDLHSLHEFLGQDRLAAPKWPQCLVFMDALPKSNTNKLLRVKLAQRLGLPEMNDRLYPVERTFLARCPPQGTDVKEPIRCEQVTVEPKAIQAVLLEALVNEDDNTSICSDVDLCRKSPEVLVAHHPTRIGSVVCYVRNVDRANAVRVAQDKLDRYAVPTHFVTLDFDSREVRSKRDLPAPQPSDALAAILRGPIDKLAPPVDPLTEQLQGLWSDLLDLDCAPHPSTNFFNLGGSSMLASQLAVKIRKKYRIPLSGAEIFHHSTCEQLAKLIKERKEELSGSGAGGGGGGTNGGGGGGGGGHLNRNLTMGSENSNKKSVASDSSAGGSSGAVFSMRKDMDLQGAKFSPVTLPPRTSIWGKLFQLVPITLLYPTHELTRFFLFFLGLLKLLSKVPGGRNLFKFVIYVIVYHTVWSTVTPLLFVLIKWTIIGRYREGRYPIWGTYYFRWWFVNVCHKIIGRGIFGTSDDLVAIYYWLLGANIGPGARISADSGVGEWDLVTVGAGAGIDSAKLRPFSVDNGAMILGPVEVGDHASVGIKCVVAPYTSVPAGCHLAPQNPSYETGRALDVSWKRYNRQQFPDAKLWVKWFVGWPILHLVALCSKMPPLFVLYLMIKQPWRDQRGDDSFNTMGDMLEWLCDPRRIPFYIGIRLARHLLSPLVGMLASVLVKRIIIGKFKPGPRDTTSQWQLLRHWLVLKLFTRDKMAQVGEILGQKFEGVSILYRMLGAKVGKRVFWPGGNLATSGEFDLLEIGDDVVLGSKTSIFLSTADSCEPVRLGAGSNLSDNVVVLPGTTLGKNAVVGSNGFSPPGRYFPEGSLWFGCRNCEPLLLEKGVEDDGGLERGKQIAKMRESNGPVDHLVSLIGDDTTLRPFGKALYYRDASYFVWPLPLVFTLNNLAHTLSVVVHSIPLLASLHLCGAALYGVSFADRDYDGVYYSTGTVYGALLVAFIFTHMLRVLLFLVVDVGSKWAIIGRRAEGRYNYDSSTYNQRWEMHQAFQRMKFVGGGRSLSLLDLIAGSPYLAQYWRWNGATIGRDCCLFPSGAYPYMLEPCLCTIGDRSVIDAAGLTCHLNTQGNFELVPVVCAEHTTMRIMSRIQMGGRMERGSMLLERSLLMTGEVVESDSIWYGQPAVPVMYLGVPNTGRHDQMSYMPNDYSNSIV